MQALHLPGSDLPCARVLRTRDTREHLAPAPSCLQGDLLVVAMRLMEGGSLGAALQCEKARGELRWGARRGAGLGAGPGAQGRSAAPCCGQQGRRAA